MLVDDCAVLSQGFTFELQGDHYAICFFGGTVRDLADK